MFYISPFNSPFPKGDKSKGCPLFKGSWQVGAIATTCLRVPLFLCLSPFNLLGGIKVISCRLGHRSRTDICAHSSHFGTHSGCPLCYEMPRSSFHKGDKYRGNPLA